VAHLPRTTGPARPVAPVAVLPEAREPCPAVEVITTITTTTITMSRERSRPRPVGITCIRNSRRRRRRHLNIVNRIWSHRTGIQPRGTEHQLTIHGLQVG